MGGTTIQPEDQPGTKTDQPPKEKTDQPPKKKKKKRHTSTWVAGISALAAVAALIFSAVQVRMSGKQNDVDEQQQLVDLTTKIAQHYTQEQEAAGQQSTGVPGNTAVASQSQGVAELIVRLTVEGQAGALLIEDLNGNGVTSTEYDEVGQALEVGGHTADAIKYYKAAVTAPPKDAETTATAQRYLADIYYSLHQYGKYHSYLMQAVEDFDGHLVEAPDIRANSKAQAYLMDVFYQLIYKRCKDAQGDMSNAANATKNYGQNTVVQNLTTRDNTWYGNVCKGSQ